MKMRLSDRMRLTRRIDAREAHRHKMERVNDCVLLLLSLALILIMKFLLT